MSINNKFSKDTNIRGAAFVETILTLPLLIVIFTLTFEFTNVLGILVDLSGPCYEGARYSSSMQTLDVAQQDLVRTTVELDTQGNPTPPIGDLRHAEIHRRISSLLRYKHNLRGKTIEVESKVDPLDVNNTRIVRITLKTRYGSVEKRLKPPRYNYLKIC